MTKDYILEWQKGSKGKAEEQPIELMLTAPFITTTLTRQTLGKPNREETGIVPFLFNHRGEEVSGPIYWYGSVGLCFVKTDFNKVDDEYLVMMKYQPK